MICQAYYDIYMKPISGAKYNSIILRDDITSL